MLKTNFNKRLTLYIFSSSFHRSQSRNSRQNAKISIDKPMINIIVLLIFARYDNFHKNPFVWMIHLSSFLRVCLYLDQERNHLPKYSTISDSHFWQRKLFHWQDITIPFILHLKGAFVYSNCHLLPECHQVRSTVVSYYDDGFWIHE